MESSPKRIKLMATTSPQSDSGGHRDQSPSEVKKTREQKKKGVPKQEKERKQEKKGEQKERNEGNEGSSSHESQAGTKVDSGEHITSSGTDSDYGGVQRKTQSKAEVGSTSPLRTKDISSDAFNWSPPTEVSQQGQRREYSTFLQLMGHYRLTERHYNQTVKDSHLEKLSRSGCKQWKSLPSHLKLETIVAEDIDKTQKEEREKRYDFLLKWKNTEGSAATYAQLISALLKIRCRRDAELLCEMVQKSARQSQPHTSGPETKPTFSDTPSAPSQLDPNSPIYRDLKRQLNKDLQNITGRYSSYVKQIRIALQDNGVTVKDLSETLMDFAAFNVGEEKLVSLSTHVAELEKAVDLHDVFKLIRMEYASFLNYDIFQYIVNAYKINCEQEELKYPQHLRDYAEKLKLSEFFEINPQLKEVSAFSSEVIVKIDIESTSRLSRITDLQSAIANILGMKSCAALQLRDISAGCVVVTFVIPTHIAEIVFNKHACFTDKQVQMFQAESVLWLECNGCTFSFATKGFEEKAQKEEEACEQRHRIPYNFVLEPDSSLKCVICLEVAENPLKHVECGKLFCSECIEKYGEKKRCAYCQIQGSEFFPDRRSRTVIEELAVKCTHMDNGCEWEGTVERLQDHLSTCEWSHKMSARYHPDLRHDVTPTQGSKRFGSDVDVTQYLNTPHMESSPKRIKLMPTTSSQSDSDGHGDQSPSEVKPCPTSPPGDNEMDPDPDIPFDACNPTAPVIPPRKVSRQERRRKKREQEKKRLKGNNKKKNKREKKRKQHKGNHPPLSLDSIMDVLEGVASLWRDVGETLHLPDTTLKVIKLESVSDVERLRAVLRYWLQHDPHASWKMLMWALCYSKIPDLNGVADNIRNYAEPLADPSLTSRNVLRAVQGNMHVFEAPLQVKMKLQQNMEGLVNYFLQTHPYASWEWLGGKLLYLEQDKSVQYVKSHIKPDEDPTLTLTSLSQLLGSVQDWSVFHVWLQIPLSVINQYSTYAQRVQGSCEWYLKNNPAPSWLQVAGALYHSREHDVLNVLRSQVAYLKGSKESRHRFSEAMKDGHVDSFINKVVLYGAAGTGKSSFMEIVVDNPPPDIRRSTPLAARPTSVFQIDSADSWTKLTLQQRRELIAKAMMHVDAGQDNEEDVSSDSDSISSGEEEAVGAVNTEVLTTEHLSSTQDPNPRLHPIALPPTSPKVPRCRTSRLQSIAACDHLVQLVEQCSRTGEAITSYRKIIFIDSGGQPQFHEMLPAFLRRMTLFVFVFKLSEELAAKPVVEYYNSKGEVVGTPYQSAQTNEQLFQHCLRTLHTHKTTSGSECKSSRIMIVGTHRDREGECTTETRTDKNKKLASLLLPAFKDEVIYSNLAENEFIFAVNAKDPQPRDKDLVRDVQRLILSDCSPNPVKVPLRYYCLELVLEEASQSLGRGVLSIDECLEAASQLHFDKHTLDAALEFLDEISVLFYYPEILEGVVFTNPQVLLDKATEPVEKIHSLRKVSSGSEMIVLGEWREFKDHALFTLAFLDDSAFQKHYVAGLFTPVELVKLFRRLLIIADFSTTKYFMPALLEVLEEDRVCEHRVPDDSPAAALALDFPLGGPRLGTFCTLTCFLVSLNNQFPCPWKIVLHRKSVIPACLYRNCIQFSLPGYPGTVTLIDTFSHFEVHVTTAERVAGELCMIVRRAIFAGLKKAHLTLGYSDCTPSPAVLCPCGEGSVHIATVGKGFWVCKEDPNTYGDLTARQLVWEESKSRQTDQITEGEFTTANGILKQYSHKWREIGRALGFKANELDNITSRSLLLHSAPNSYLSAMLSEWQLWAPGDHRGSRAYATLYSLRTAVDRAGLGLTAQEL